MDIKAFCVDDDLEIREVNIWRFAMLSGSIRVYKVLGYDGTYSVVFPWGRKSCVDIVYV